MNRTVSIFLCLTIVSGTLIVVSTEKWFIIWVGLEISTLALVPVLCSKFAPRKIEARIKYFLIQALSAALLLKGALIQAWLAGSWSILDPSKKVTAICLRAALAFKLGLAPCHFWFPDVLQGLPFVQGLIIATWQKIAPLIILFSFTQIVFTKLLVVAGLLSILIGGWGGLNQTQVRKILAFSSIAKMGWIVVTSAYSATAALLMLTVYLVIKTAIFLLFDLLKVSTLGHLKTTAQLSPMRVMLVTLTILSLGGLPPLTGFILKFTSLYFLISKNFIVLSAVMVMGSLLRLFFYLRISFNASLVLFPQHIIRLTSWRKKAYGTTFSPKVWVVSIFTTIRITAIPLTLPLYIIT